MFKNQLVILQNEMSWFLNKTKSFGILDLHFKMGEEDKLALFQMFDQSSSHI